MLDIKVLRQEPERIKEALKKRFNPLDIEPAIELDKQRRAILAEVEQKKAKQNEITKQIPQMKKNGENTDQIFAEMKELSNDIKADDEKVRDIDEQLRNFMLRIPNIPNPEVPVGKDDTENVELRKFSEPRKFDFEPKAHWDIGTDLDILDFERNCAKEPHIVDLANFLNAMGAKVSGAGTDVIKVRGVGQLKGGNYTIIPDQIEAGTYMAAAAAVGGDVTVDNVIPKHLDCITAKLREMGAKVTEYDDAIRVEADHRLRRSNVKTMPYPGFPTDMQPQIAVCMALAEGTSLVTEGIYDNRFRYTAELNRMGASIQVESKTAVIDGVTQLHGCEVRACDLRAGAAMVIAALCAEGTTTIEDAHYIERGYEDIIGKFSAIGGKIRRIETFEGNSQSAAG